MWNCDKFSLAAWVEKRSHTPIWPALMLNCVGLDFLLASNTVDTGLKNDPKGKW